MFSDSFRTGSSTATEAATSRPLRGILICRVFMTAITSIEKVKTKERYSMRLKLWTSEPASEKVGPECQGVEEATKESDAWTIKEK